MIRPMNIVILICFQITYFLIISNVQAQSIIYPNKQLNIGDECITINLNKGICTKNWKNCLEPEFNNTKRLLRKKIVFIRNSKCSLSAKNAICCMTKNVTKPIIKNQMYYEHLPYLKNSKLCGNTVENRISGGLPTGLRDYPWTALLKYESTEKSLEYKCAGSLISERYVLTANHCMVAAFLNEVRLGEWDLNAEIDCINNGGICADKPIDVGVEKIITHREKQRIIGENDIALLKLNITIIYTNYIQPICLPIETSLKRKNYVNTMLTIVGWGTTETHTRSNKKLATKILGQLTEICDNALWRTHAYKLNNRTNLCAGGDGIHDACSGDSGGPLMYQDFESNQPNWIIIGIVSYGVGCARQNYPGVYTRVDAYMQWILNEIQKQN